MRKLVSLFLLFTMALSGLAQEVKEKQFYVYLWDVTLSMRGPKYDGEADIWDKTMDWLINEIETKNTNPNDTIVVCPFNESIITGDKGLRKDRSGSISEQPYMTFGENESIEYDSPWKVPSTNNGKRELIEKIRNFKQPKNGHTNLYDPLKYAVENYEDTLKHATTIYMLTDGIDDFNQDRNKFTDFVNKNWNVDGSLLVFIRLTSKASEGIKERKNVITIDPKERFMELSVNQSGSYNYRDAEKKNDRSIVFTVKPEQELFKLPQGLRIRIKSDNNPYIKIDGEYSVIDGMIKAELKYDSNDIISNNIKECNLKLNYTIVDNEMKGDDGYIYKMSISNNSSKTIKFINDTQNKLTIRFKNKSENQ